MNFIAIALLALTQSPDLSTRTATDAPTEAEAATSSASIARPEPVREEPREEPAPPKPKPAPYSLPFQLRPAGVGNVFRLDTAAAFYDRADGAANTTASFATLVLKLHDDFGALARFGFTSDNLAGPNNTGSAFMNPVLGVVYAQALPHDLRLAAVLLTALPFGSGGGDQPDTAGKRARTAAVYARSALDNAALATNDLTIAPGVDLAWVKHGVTAQIEATLFLLFRRRGELDQPDERKINFTSAMHLGYFLTSWVSIGGEMRWQRWILEPKAVKNAMNRDALLSQLSFAIGPRFHVDLGGGRWIRPAIVYVRGVDDPMSAAGYDILHVDVPFAF